MSEELKPCPFCGGREISVKHDDGIHWLRCDTCEATGPTLTKYHGEEGEPCVDWNTRVNTNDR